MSKNYYKYKRRDNKPPQYRKGYSSGHKHIYINDELFEVFKNYAFIKGDKYLELLENYMKHYIVINKEEVESKIELFYNKNNDSDEKEE